MPTNCRSSGITAVGATGVANRHRQDGGGGLRLSGSASRSGRPRLLFVAHREEILKQALRTYLVLRDHAFGEVLVGGAA